MIDDEHVDALRAKIGDLFVGVGAAVQGNEEITIGRLSSNAAGKGSSGEALIKLRNIDQKIKEL